MRKLIFVEALMRRSAFVVILLLAAGATGMDITRTADASDVGDRSAWLVNPALAWANVENSLYAQAKPVAVTRKASLEQMIGQMIMVGFTGTAKNDPGVKAVRRELKDGLIGGVLLLARNVASPKQVRLLSKSLREASGNRIPLISVDQEGGAIQRLKARTGHLTFPSARHVASNPKFRTGSNVLSLYAKMASELRSGGINVNFGPVVDLNINPENPIIGRLGRSYGTDPDRVSLYARWFALAHQGAGILTVAKHFPGHGSSKTDSHVDYTDISKSWKKEELKPFIDLAEDQFVDMVMVGHLYHPKFSDGPGIPASLSKKSITALRRDFGFKGVIITDDLDMGALRKHFSFEERIVRAIRAGEDMLVFANLIDPKNDLGARIHKVIVQAVRDGRIKKSRIADAYKRIMEMKSGLANSKLAKRH